MEEPNYIYQYSLLNALMDGVSASGIPVSKFLSKGNQGLGTFVLMDGELLSLDGVVYQLQSEGRVRIAGKDEQIPFGVTTNFVAEETETVKLDHKTAIDKILDANLPPSTNLFVTYRITGTFSHIKARTVKGQEYPGQPLSELGDSQFVSEYNDISGTVIGFRSPKAFQGLAVAGEHLHFISEDRKVGGHVLEITGEGLEMGMARVKDVHIELPTGQDFNEATLVSDDAGIKKVEG